MIKLLASGGGTGIAAELGISRNEVRTHVQRILVKLQVHSRLDPPPSPVTAAAALAVPFQRAEDLPRHVGRYLRRKGRSS